MDIQFYGANAVVISYKSARIVIDDNLAALGGKSITKDSDEAALFTGTPVSSKAKLVFSGPGEYEVSDISITGIPARLHLEEDSKKLDGTMYKISAGDQTILVVGHIYPEISESQAETIGIVDVMVAPVGGNGFTLDSVGVLKLIKELEPKVLIPTYYNDSSLTFEVPPRNLDDAIKELSMEPRERVTKFKFKPGESSDITQLVILEKS